MRTTFWRASLEGWLLAQRFVIVLRGFFFSRCEQEKKKRLRMRAGYLEKLAFVYMLECADGSYYVGSHRGADVQNRVDEHEQGLRRDAYTFKRRPVKLVWSDWFSRFDDAVAFERRLKGWRRAKKEALIRGDYDALRQLAKRPNARKKSKPSS